MIERASRAICVGMEQPQNLKGAGFGYLGAGMAFLGVAASGQLAFLGVGMAFIGLGIAFLAQSRRPG